MIHFGEHLRRMRILVVDDVVVNVTLLERILRSAGFDNVEVTTSSARALASCIEHVPDLLLLDLHMPQISGYEILNALGPTIRTGEGTAVLVLTGDVSPDARRRALDAGARDFVAKPFDFDEVLLRVRNLLEVRYFQRELATQNERLESAVQARTAELFAGRAEILDRLALVAEFRDDETNDHARRIGRSSLAMARSLGIATDVLALFERAAALHDIGKIAISDEILRKPGRLTPEERSEMQRHTTVGAQILADSHSPVLRLAQRIALHHHERWDGSGYPQGLRAEEIPIEGRVVAVADVFDALTHDRPYKRAWPVPDAVAEIRTGRGTMFDPAVVAAFEAQDPATLVEPILRPQSV